MSAESRTVNCDGRRAQAWSFEHEFTQRLCTIVGSLVALEAKGILAEEPESYRSLTVDPERYTDHRHFAEDYLVASLLRKSSALPIKADREAEALNGFLRDEAHNRKTNDRLWSEPLPQWWGEYSRLLLTIVGPLGGPELAGIVRAAKHGSGATVGVSSEMLVASKKYDSKPTCSAALLPFLGSIWPESVSELNSQTKPKVGKGGTFFTVPKDAWTDRGCVKSLTWNQWFQQGIKHHLEQRLRRFGVNIDSQDRNRYLASQAQERGLATIDLSSASNLNARVALYLAFCYNQDPNGVKWYKLLDLAREKAVRLIPGGHHVPLEMFCSMGNAFTFPLECCVFLSVVLSVVGEDSSDVAVYGDDIICPAKYAPEVLRRLEFIGFKVNHQKTFLAGRFFESCGTDWFSGQNVRPFFLRVDPEAPHVPQALIAANRLREWLLRVYGYCPTRYQSLWQWCVDQIPHPWCLPVSPSLGDTGYHVAFSERKRLPHTRLKAGKHVVIDTRHAEGVLVEHVKVTPVKLDRKSAGVILSALAQLDGPAERPQLPDTDLWSPNVSPQWRIQAGIRALRDKKWQWAKQMIRENPESMGLEPVRGLLRRPSTIKTLVPCWGDELLWI